MKDMDAAGDLIHEDPDRDMRITLRSTTLKGAIQNAYLELDTGSRWFATGDSTVTLLGDIDTTQVDAPEGVTITLTGKQDATEQLASGGLLVCHQ